MSCPYAVNIRIFLYFLSKSYSVVVNNSKSLFVFLCNAQLYDAALRRPVGDKVEFVTFDGEHGYGHKHIHKSPDLVPIIR
jgi:hypothetical protein